MLDVQSLKPHILVATAIIKVECVVAMLQRSQLLWREWCRVFHSAFSEAVCFEQGRCTSHNWIEAPAPFFQLCVKFLTCIPLFFLKHFKVWVLP